jgi:hypothetical protein
MATLVSAMNIQTILLSSPRISSLRAKDGYEVCSSVIWHMEPQRVIQEEHS